MQNYPQVKRIPARIGKQLRFAVQHYESVTKRAYEIDDSLTAAIMLPTITRVLGDLDYAIDWAKTLMENEVALVAFSPADSAVYTLAIVEWREELWRNNVPGNGTKMWGEAVHMTDEWDNAKWSPVR